MMLFSPKAVVLVFLTAGFLFVLFVRCDTSRNSRGDNPAEKPQDASTSVVNRSIELSTNEFIVINELASGVERRGLGDCVTLNIDGIKAAGRRDVYFGVFLNRPDADQTTSMDAPHYIGNFSLGHSAGDQKGVSYAFGLDKTIKRLGDELLKDLNKGEISVSVVPYPVSPGDTEGLEKVNVSISQISLTVKCD